ncbi:MAG: ATPase, T2SS/T4P/T4SS family, partial [Patescibacteria group bacterium]
TLHTNSAAGALPRLIDMGIEAFLIASTTNAILAQRLVRKLYGEKEKYTLSKDQIKNLAELFNLDRILEVMKDKKIVGQDSDWKTIPFYKAKPSKECPSGYKGRVGLYEVLEISDHIKDLILKKATYKEIDEAARVAGMTSMLEDGFIKATQGYTSIEEILRVTKE